MYGHVITKFSGMGRFTKLWGFARAWISAIKTVIHKQSLKHNLNEQNNGKLVSLIGYA